MSDPSERLRDEVAEVVRRVESGTRIHNPDGSIAGYAITADEWRECRATLARVRDEARGEALREAADAWQWGEWTVLTPKINNPSGDPASRVIGAAQAVTDWLRARADEVTP